MKAGVRGINSRGIFSTHNSLNFPLKRAITPCNPWKFSSSFLKCSWDKVLLIHCHTSLPHQIIPIVQCCNFWLIDSTLRLKPPSRPGEVETGAMLDQCIVTLNSDNKKVNMIYISRMPTCERCEGVDGPIKRGIGATLASDWLIPDKVTALLSWSETLC